jgi:hypothetical protein
VGIRCLLLLLLPRHGPCCSTAQLLLLGLCWCHLLQLLLLLLLDDRSCRGSLVATWGVQMLLL